jgi:hypothetical protein
MNEAVNLAELALQTLSSNVVHLLKTEIGDRGIVGAVGNHILLSISKADFETRLGNLLQQIYRVVDVNFPVRHQHLSLIIRDTQGKYESIFKIWKTK